MIHKAKAGGYLPNFLKSMHVIENKLPNIPKSMIDIPCFELVYTENLSLQLQAVEELPKQKYNQRSALKSLILTDINSRNQVCRHVASLTSFTRGIHDGNENS